MRRFLDKHIVLLTLIPVLAVMIMIFRFSSQTGEESGALSDRITVFVLRRSGFSCSGISARLAAKPRCGGPPFGLLRSAFCTPFPTSSTRALSAGAAPGSSTWRSTARAFAAASLSWR